MNDRGPDLLRARRTAHQTLLESGGDQLPVDVLGLLLQVKNARVLTYAQAGAMVGHSVYTLAGALPSSHACTLYQGRPGASRYIVLYNDDICFASQPRWRFSLAHELGHILLGHEGQYPFQEKEADAFAGQLLCPRPLVRLMPRREELIMLAFGLSRQAARTAFLHSQPGDDDSALSRALVEKYCPRGDWREMLSPIQRAACRIKMRGRAPLSGREYL